MFTVFTDELPRFYLNRAQTLDSARNSLQRIICPLYLKAQLVQDLLKAGSDSTVQMFKHMRRVLVFPKQSDTILLKRGRLTRSALTAAHFPLKLRFKELRFVRRPQHQLALSNAGSHDNYRKGRGEIACKTAVLAHAGHLYKQ